jgi:hypothetical protein
MSKQMMLYVGLGLYLAALWAVLIHQRDHPFVVVQVAWLASPLLLLVLRVTLEDGLPEGLFSWKTQSWAFLFGDILWLPMAFGFAAYGQRFVPDDSVFRSFWWLTVCVVVGVGAGLLFHSMDTGAYIDAGSEWALKSPSKWAHDFVAYPLLFGGLFYLGLPVAVHHFKWTGAVILLGVLLWIAMGGKDTVSKPRPANLHPDWNEGTFSVRK